MKGTPPAINVANLAIRKNGVAIVRQLSFSVPPGSITGLIGPSGSGKTTLMRAIVGAQAITGGSITVLGMTAGTASLRRRIGYVTQAPAVYPDLTVGQNLHYFGTILGVRPQKITETLATVELTAQEKQLAATLSGGQRARVSLAVALLGDPEILILDEPTVGLDPLLREKLWSLFKDLAKTDKTLLVSSHVMDEAGRCDNLLLLREGSLLASASPEALLRTTGAANLEAAFIASIKQSRREDGSTT